MTKDPTVSVTEVMVSLLPEAHIDYRTFAVTVSYRGRGLWAVVHGGFCLGADGGWDYDRPPAQRVEEWWATHRYGYATALRKAIAIAPDVRVNRVTAATAAAEASDRAT